MSKLADDISLKYTKLRNYDLPYKNICRNVKTLKAKEIEQPVTTDKFMSAKIELNELNSHFENVEKKNKLNTFANNVIRTPEKGTKKHSVSCGTKVVMAAPRA